MSGDMRRRAVVFAYHNVGVRCLRVLAARGIQVELVVTHEDNASESIWFGSVKTCMRASPPSRRISSFRSTTGT